MEFKHGLQEYLQSQVVYIRYGRPRPDDGRPANRRSRDGFRSGDFGSVEPVREHRLGVNDPTEPQGEVARRHPSDAAGGRPRAAALPTPMNPSTRGGHYATRELLADTRTTSE